MPSLDFVYDLTEKLDQEKLNYLVLTIREGRSEDKVDVFFNIEKDFEEVFKVSVDQVKQIISDRSDEDQGPSKPKKRRKKK